MNSRQMCETIVDILILEMRQTRINEDKCLKSTARKCQSWGLNGDVLELFLFLTTTQHSQIK